jgi:hypothetical protein
MSFIRTALFFGIVTAVILAGIALQSPGSRARSLAKDSTANHGAAVSTNQPWGAKYGAEAIGTTNISPVGQFRALLAMNKEQREKTLAEETETRRNWLRGKLTEYEGMTFTERELRFRTTELRWYLLPLMRMSASDREKEEVNWRNTVPKGYHTLLEARLQQWDKLSPDLQKDVVENELTMSYFMRLTNATFAQQQLILASLSKDRRDKLETNLAAFRTLSPDRRERMLGQFGQFFDLNEKEKERVLGELSAGDRVQVTQKLNGFDKLSANERVLCIKSLEKFANMTPAEQALFMQNAELWKKMSESEQKLWRNLVSEVPPMPPGFGEPPMPAEFYSDLLNPGARPIHRTEAGVNK